ncbi:MAG: sensor histidine kinase [Flavobacteriales bacterium]|jgi:two-component system LytT family sensor kinase
MSRYWIFQIIGWIGMIFVEQFNYGVAVRWNYDWKFVGYFMAYPIFGLLLSHCLRYILKRKNVFSNSQGKIIFIGMLSFIGWTSVMALLVQMPEFFLDREVFYKTNTPLFFTLNVVNLSRYTIVWITIYFFYQILVKSSQLEIEKIELDNDKKVTELKLLRTQLNPHFLFNALNSIKALVLVDPRAAREGIVKLSEILRFSLSSSSRDAVSVSEELEMVQQYLQVEKLRFGSRFSYYISKEAESEDIKIPVGIILTLVENGIKHGVSKRNGDSEIHLIVKCTKRYLSVEVKNSGSIVKDESGLGIGLQFVKKRLKAFYNQVEIELQEVGEMVSVNVMAKV